MTISNTFQEKISKALKTWEFGGRPAELYDPISYILELGGKRLRPQLALHACSLYTDDVEPAVLPALGVEVFHNFTLMHDDIMDEAPTRRGKATVHQRWDANVAILSGDTMLVKAYELIMKVPDDVLRPALDYFNKCAVEVCEGQQIDMNFERNEVVDVPDYLEMIRLKTAVLLGYALRLGAMTGRAGTSDCDNIDRFGQQVGIGFQLKDDLLDVYGDTEKVGKQQGGDIIANKKTYLLIKALQNADRNQSNELKKWIAAKSFEPEEKVTAVKNIYDELQIAAITQKEMNHHFEKGFEYLHRLQCDGEKRKGLEDFSYALINREK